jgi:glutamate--cysteine ligase
MLAFATQLFAQSAAIEAWFTAQWQLTPPPFYCSVDLRNAGLKLAPVDTNLFPAGFNNLNPALNKQASQAVNTTLLTLFGDTIKRVVIIPENHSRNPYYAESLARLNHLIQDAGFITQIVKLDEQSNPDQINLDLINSDLIILNNDLSDGIPARLAECKRPIVPAAQLGWTHRLKSDHFEQYEHVSHAFALHFKLDPWQLNPLFENCHDVNFMTQDGIHCIYRHAQQLLKKIEYKYAQYHIQDPPFLVIKADAGTYGMAVMMIKNADELLTLNRKQRTRMSTRKGGQAVNKIILQEGVYSFERLAAAVAEPVIYLIGSQVIGGFYRVHPTRGMDENLNSPGMVFQPMELLAPAATPNPFYPYSIVARLAALAAAKEMQSLNHTQHEPKSEN